MMCLPCMSRRWIPIHKGSDAHLIHCVCKGQWYHTLNRLAASSENTGNSPRDKTRSQLFTALSNFLTSAFQKNQDNPHQQQHKLSDPSQGFPTESCLQSEVSPRKVTSGLLLSPETGTVRARVTRSRRYGGGFFHSKGYSGCQINNHVLTLDRLR